MFTLETLIYIKIWILDMLYRLKTISEIFFKSWLFLQTFLIKNSIFYSYFNCIFLPFCANKSIISETSRSSSLWINNKGNPFNVAFVIVLRFQVLTVRRDENDQVVIGKVPNSFKTKCIFQKASASTLFSVTETGKLFLNFALFQSLNQGSASRPLKIGKCS